MPQIIPNDFNILTMDLKNIPNILAQERKKNEITIVYFGTPEFSAYILERLIEFCNRTPKALTLHPWDERQDPVKFTVTAVVTNPGKLVGKKQVLTPSPVSLVSQKHNILVMKPLKLDHEFIKNHLSLLRADMFVVASYGKIIPQSLLDIPRLGTLNVHPSLLPKYRGPSPILTPILNGDTKTGVTIMLMDAVMDHGSILSTKVISISEQDNHETLTTKLAQASAPLLIDTLVKFVRGKITRKPQKHNLATFTKIIKKEDGYFDINNPPSPEILDRMIRAYYPWPGVWTRWNNKIVKLLPCHSEPASLAKRGERSEESNFLIQMEGKKAMPIKDFLNGYPDFPLKI